MNSFFLFDRLCIEYPMLTEWKGKIKVREGDLVLEETAPKQVKEVLEAVNRTDSLFLRDDLKREVGMILGVFTAGTEVEGGVILSDTNIFFKEEG